MDYYKTTAIILSIA